MHRNVKYLYDKGWKEKSESRGELIGRCPSATHEDKNPSFSINASTGYFNCHGCDCCGKALLTLRSFVENVSVHELRFEYRKDKRNKDSNTHTNLVMQRIYQHDDLKFTHKMLADRGYKNPEIVAKKFALGFVGNKSINRITRQFNHKRLMEMKHMVGSQYVPGNRVSIPIRWNKTTIGFSFRSIDGSEPKYINLVQTHKDHWLYGYSGHKETIVTEGAFDCIAVTLRGYKTVALMGCDLSSRRAELLRVKERLVFAMDGDRAGYLATRNAFFVLCNSSVPMDAIKIPDGEDPESIGEDFIDLYKERIHIVRFLILYADTMKDIQKIFEIISKIRNEYNMLWYRAIAIETLKVWLTKKIGCADFNEMLKGNLPDELNTEKVAKEILHQAISML